MNKDGKNLIPSEDQADKIGQQQTNGGQPGKDYHVFSWRHGPSGLTVFGVEIVRMEGKQVILTM